MELTYCEGIFGFKVARESRTLSQSYYMGPVVDNQDHYKVHETTGKCVDQLMGPNGIDREVDLDNLEDWEPDDERPAFDIEGAIASIPSGEEVHPHLVAIAGHLWSTGVPEETVKNLLVNLAKQSDRDRDFKVEVNKIVTYIKLKDPREESLAIPEEGKSIFAPVWRDLDGWLARTDLGKTEFTIDRVLPTTGFICLVARGGVGKTWVAMDLAIASIISGYKWMGAYPSIQTIAEDEKVWFIDSEMPETLILERWRQLLAPLSEEDRAKVGRQLIPMSPLELNSVIGGA